MPFLSNIRYSFSFQLEFFRISKISQLDNLRKNVFVSTFEIINQSYDSMIALYLQCDFCHKINGRIYVCIIHNMASVVGKATTCPIKQMVSSLRAVQWSRRDGEQPHHFHPGPHPHPYWRQFTIYHLTGYNRPPIIILLPSFRRVSSINI